jgi:perosamine synthetase
MKEKISVPVNTPLLSGNEKKYISECIETGWISSEGPYVKQFEIGFSSYIGKKHGVCVSNGSAALDIAVQAADIGEGDEVIMPAFTIISPALSVVRAGGKPVLVDCDPLTWNMDVSQIEAKVTKKTKAIIAVHIYGLPVDMAPVMQICEKHGIMLIEDAAEMIGQTYNGKKCGSFGHISIFSFYPNKHITTGEGGMILTDSQEINERCQKLRNLAFEPGRRFIHKELGWNYRMTNMQAALGMAQLENIDKHLLRKREIGAIYNDGLKNLSGFQLPLKTTSYAENIYWVYGLVAESEQRCLDVIKYLGDANIGTRPFFWCMHEQPVFLNMGLFKNEKYPHSEKIARNGFYIPSGLGLNSNELNYVIETMNSF